MANFGRELLLKYGWSEGKGLGKHENGIVEALKPKVKLNTKGVGFTDSEFKWWEFVYNKASNNLNVETSVNEAKVVVKDTDAVIIKSSKEEMNVELLKKSHPQTMVYGNFLKTSTLADEKVTKHPDFNEEIMSTIKNQDIESYALNDEELYKACGGRTAHKGARHGLNLNGKLARLEKQDQEFLDLKSLTKTVKIEKLKKKKKKKKEKDNEDFECITEKIDALEIDVALDKENDSVKKSKKLKKTSNLTDLENQMNVSLVLSNDNCEKTQELNENIAEVDQNDFIPVKSKKKKKIKGELNEGEMSIDVPTDLPVDKKRKKNRKLQETNLEDIQESVKHQSLNLDADIESNEENLIEAIQESDHKVSKKTKLKRSRQVETLTQQLAKGLELSDSSKPKKNKRKIKDVVDDEKKSKKRKKLNIVVSSDETINENQTNLMLKKLREELTEAYKLNKRIAKKKKYKLEKKEKKKDKNILNR